MGAWSLQLCTEALPAFMAPERFVAHTLGAHITYSDIVAQALHLYLMLHLALFWSLWWRNLIPLWKVHSESHRDNSSCFGGVLDQL